MAITSQIGGPDSKLGNIKLGGSSAAMYTITEQLVLVEVAQGALPTTYNVGASDNFSFTETIIPGSSRNKNIAESIAFSEAAAIRYPVINNLPVSESLALTEKVLKTVTIWKIASDAITLNEAITRGGSFLHPLSESFNINEAVSEEHFKWKPVAEVLTVTETPTYQKIITIAIAEEFELVEVLTKQGIYNCNISEVVDVKGGMIKYFRDDLGQSYWINEVELVKVPKKCYVLLEVVNDVITLPCPQMGDSETSLHSQVVKRSMTNVLYTYVRRNDLQQLSYTFILGRPLAYDLQAFVENNIGQRITLTNWKGEVWKVRITSNPLDFVGLSRFENEGEKWQVAIEFQGLRII